MFENGREDLGSINDAQKKNTLKYEQVALRKILDPQRPKKVFEMIFPRGGPWGSTNCF